MQSKSFEEWCAEVDKCIQRKTGLRRDDLPDWRYRHDYEDGVSPSRAAARAIKNAKEW